MIVYVKRWIKASLLVTTGTQIAWMLKGASLEVVETYAELFILAMCYEMSFRYFVGTPNRCINNYHSYAEWSYLHAIIYSCVIWLCGAFTIKHFHPTDFIYLPVGYFIFVLIGELLHAICDFALQHLKSFTLD